MSRMQIFFPVSVDTTCVAHFASGYAIVANANFRAEIKNPSDDFAAGGGGSGRVGRIRGELKLSLEYRKGALLVMVHHAKNLSMPDGSKEEPNSYVKVRFRFIAFRDAASSVDLSPPGPAQGDEEEDQSGAQEQPPDVHGNGESAGKARGNGVTKSSICRSSIACPWRGFAAARCRPRSGRIDFR